MTNIEVQTLTDEVSDMLSNTEIGTGLDRYGKYNTKESRHGMLIVIDVTCGQSLLNETPFNVHQLAKSVSEDDMEAFGAYEQLEKLRKKSLVAIGCHKNPVMAFDNAVQDFAQVRARYEELLAKRKEVYADVSPLGWISIDDEIPEFSNECYDGSSVYEVISAHGHLLQATFESSDTNGQQSWYFNGVNVVANRGDWDVVASLGEIEVHYWRKLPSPPRPKPNYKF